MVFRLQEFKHETDTYRGVRNFILPSTLTLIFHLPIEYGGSLTEVICGSGSKTCAVSPSSIGFNFG